MFLLKLCKLQAVSSFPTEQHNPKALYRSVFGQKALKCKSLEPLVRAFLISYCNSRSSLGLSQTARYSCLRGQLLFYRCGKCADAAANRFGVCILPFNTSKGKSTCVMLMSGGKVV